MDTIVSYKKVVFANDCFKNYNSLFDIISDDDPEGTRYFIKMKDTNDKTLFKFEVKRYSVHIFNGLYFENRKLLIEKTKTIENIYEDILKLRCEKFKDMIISFDTIKAIIPSDSDIIDYIVTKNESVKKAYDYIVGLCMVPDDEKENII